MLDFEKLLTRLSSVMSVSSREYMAHDFFIDLCKPYFDEIDTDVNGSIIALKRCGKPDAKKLQLDAHLDEIGLAVSEITEKGFVKFVSIGGVDAGILPASELLIYGKKTVRGIVASTPPHLLPAAARGKKPELANLYIDTGYTKSEISEIVSIGDLIGFDTKYAPLLNKRFYSKGMDDRACALCIIGAVELLKDEDFAYDICVSLTVREETGYVGVKGAAYKAKPDMAIVVDVDHARLPGSTDFARCEIGKGGSITYTDTLCRHLSDALIRSAHRSGAMYQITADTGPTGTNAHALQTACEGVPSVVLSLPLKNMHTPVEICDTGDMESVARIIAAFAKDGEYNGEEAILIDRE